MCTKIKITTSVFMEKVQIYFHSRLPAGCNQTEHQSKWTGGHRTTPKALNTNARGQVWSIYRERCQQLNPALRWIKCAYLNCFNIIPSCYFLDPLPGKPSPEIRTERKREHKRAFRMGSTPTAGRGAHIPRGHPRPDYSASSEWFNCTE